MQIRIHPYGTQMAGATTLDRAALAPILFAIPTFAAMVALFPVIRLFLHGQCCGLGGSTAMIMALGAIPASALGGPVLGVLLDSRLAGADMVTAITMCYAEEAIGITRAAQAALLPVVISFTVETDGNLPTGQSLEEAIQEVDSATDSAPIYYMINCAHPSHFENLLVSGGEWVRRIRGIRANASSCSHAELDEATELDDGDPDELGQRYAVLRSQCPQLNVFGGCCGTDQRHVGAIALVVQGAVAPPGSSA